MDLIGLDTCVLIYHFERNPVHFAPASRVFSELDDPKGLLRAEHPALRAPDAIHVATALEAGARGFVTADRRLEALSKDVPIIMLSDFVATLP